MSASHADDDIRRTLRDVKWVVRYILGPFSFKFPPPYFTGSPVEIIN